MHNQQMIVGIGNPDRGDDAIGLVVADQLRDKLKSDIRVFKSNGEISQLLKWFEDIDSMIFIDASSSTSLEPGEVNRFDIHDGPLPQIFDNLSTHGIGLGEALELARAMDLLPGSCIVYTVEGENYEAGGELTERVKAATELVVTAVLKEIQAYPESCIQNA